MAVSIAGAAMFLFGVFCVCKECRARRSGRARFTTKYPSVFSMLCLMSPLLVELNEAWACFVPFCHFRVNYGTSSMH